MNFWTIHFLKPTGTKACRLNKPLKLFSLNASKSFPVAASGFLLLFLFIFSAQAQVKTKTYLDDPKAGARDKNFDTESLLLEVAFVPEKGLVNGKVTLTFSALLQETDTLFLDAPDIEVLGATLDKNNVEFSTNKEGIIIRPGKPLTWQGKHQLAIDYTATPRKGIYFIGWNEPEPLNPAPYSVRRQIWTQGQGVDNRYWIPCFDDMNDKLISEVKITFDKSYRVLSNGSLLAEKNLPGGKNKLWHYKMPEPHSPYLIMLGIGKYDVKQLKSKSGVSVDCWYYPEFPERVAPTYRYSAEMLDWMEKEFGLPYPWGKKYSQIPVQDFMYGAMENTTATVFGDFYFIDERSYLDRSYVGTNAHELAHQWFGDYVTSRAGEGTWLQESFATHYQKHFERSVFGEDHFQWNRRQEMQSVLEAGKRDSKPVINTGAGTERVYQKGSLVLDMLKYVLGKEQFNKALTYYLKKHPYGNVDTHDFYIAFLETLGINLDWFFDEWLYRGGEPKYEVQFEELTNSAGKFSRFTVKQTHQTNELVGLFKMPVWFEVYYTDGSSDRKQEWLSEQTQIIDMANSGGKQIDYALFDPNSEIIKNINFPKSMEMLKAQTVKAKNMIDRYDALLALGNLPVQNRKDFLLDAFAKEPFWGVRAEMAKQLATYIDDMNGQQMRQVISDKHPKVRLAFLQGIEAIPQRFLADFENLLQDSSYVLVENALETLCAQHPENISKYLTATESVTGNSNSIRITWLEIACGTNRQQYLPQLVNYTSPQWEFRTRTNAMEVLKRLNYLDETVIANLFNACFSGNSRLRAPAKTLLKHFMIQTDYKKMVTDYYTKNKFEDWQAGMVKDLF